MKNKFIVLGGDLRFIYAAAKLNKQYDCAVYGFDKLHNDVHKETGVTILKKIGQYSNVVLPLPMSRNCDYITAPYYSGKIPISAVIDAAEENATIYCGKACPELRKMCREKSLTLVDYFEREELIVANAAIAAFQKSLSKPTLYQCGENRHVMRYLSLSLYHKSRQKASLFSKNISLDFIKSRLVILWQCLLCCLYFSLGIFRLNIFCDHRLNQHIATHIALACEDCQFFEHFGGQPN